MDASLNIFKFGDVIIDFANAFPKVNGVVMVHKTEWLELVRIAVRYVGYKFDHITHPVPAIIVNWNQCSKHTLRRWMIRIFRDISLLPPEIVRMCRLDIGGFVVEKPNDKKVYRPCRLELKAENYHQVAFCFENDVPNVVERFMNTNFINKMILIN